MTVSIPKPNWRAVQGLRERATGAVVRLGRSPAAAEARAARTSEWSDVMQGRVPVQAATSAEAAAPTARGRSAAQAQAAAAARPATERQRREVNSAWVLATMLLVVCLVAVGWVFAHGTAATLWLVALIAVAFAGVPIGLIALRLFGCDDVD